MKVIQVKEFSTNNVVKEIDVSNKGEKEIERIDSGLNINLDHERFYTIIKRENLK